MTITERTPTPPEYKDVHTYTIRKNSMMEILDFLRDAELNFTCWVIVTITFIDE